jgi:hypothetical protein
MAVLLRHVFEQEAEVSERLCEPDAKFWVLSI